MIQALFAALPERWSYYKAPLHAAFAEHGLDVNLFTQIPDGMGPEDIDYIIYAPNSNLTDFSPYTNLRAVLNLWAGVEAITPNPTLRAPLCRMVDPGLTQGMVEWVTGHALRYHLGMDAHTAAAPGVWQPQAPPLSWDRRVTILGLGELGTACAKMLAQIGFDVTGWARTSKDIDTITCLHGQAALTCALQTAQILITLLPDTPATTNVLNDKTLALLPRGAMIINPGRGPLIDDDALLRALDCGQVGHATLDVFRTEPLPPEHPYWSHPKVTVTPHIAAETRPKYSSITIARNIARDQQGAELLHKVDRKIGY